MKDNALILTAISGLCAFSQQAEANVLHLSLANSYHPNVELSDYYVSEKFDGIRAYWDGKHLYSRQGNTFNAPSYFLQKLPTFPIEGELWLGRGSFQDLNSIIKNSTRSLEWDRIIYKVFDVPKHEGNYDTRLNFLRKNLALNENVALVPQVKVANEKELYKKLKQVESLGGEGLVLHQISSSYIGARSDQLLKLKSFSDEEAVVLGIVEGLGKYKGMMGALWVRNANGKVFKIGSGFSDKERKDPPEIGKMLTYRYSGVTDKGIPRFARFLRLRDPNE